MTPVPSGTPGTRQSGFLRPEPSRFFGRALELAELDDPMASSLVSIVGPAGIGKTRLALRFATTRKDRYRSVWFCDLRDARDVEEMTALALRTFAVRDESGTSAVDASTAVARALAARVGSLVILDNLEHLLPDAASTIRRWVAAAPDVRFVVTSRVPIGLPGERVVELGAMPVPEPGAVSSDAVELFLERVRSRSAEWTPEGDELPVIADIVRQLRGVPLAIELAAARIGTDDARSVLSRVVQRSSPPPGVENAPLSTRRAIDRAFALLAPSERETLAQCSVFRGSFTLAAATQVVRLSEAGAPAIDVVTSLAHKNLLQVDGYQPMRFSMCEGIRSIASEALALSLEAEAVEWRHALHFVERAEAIVGDAAPVDAASDWEDLQAVMVYGDAHDHPHIVLRAALAIDVLAPGSGLGSARLEILDRALRGGATGDLRLLSRALGVRSNALYALGRLDEARADAEMALRLATERRDLVQMGAMRRAAGECEFQLGNLDAAREHLEQALEIEVDRGEALAIASVHCHLGSLHQSMGEADRARDDFESCLRIALRMKSAVLEARAMMGLAWHWFEAGDREGARQHYDRALHLLRRLRMKRSERIIIGYLGVLHFEAGALTEAEDHLRRSTFASRQAGDFRVEGIFEGVRGGVLAALDCVEEARASFDLADELLTGNPFYAGSIAVYRGHLDLAEARAAAVRGDAHSALALVKRARERIRAAHVSHDGLPPLVCRSDDARMAVRILERAIEALTG